MEKLVLKKRIYELVAGDIFWFSGNWRIVERLDRDTGLLHWKTESSPAGKDTIMIKSKMLVAVR